MIIRPAQIKDIPQCQELQRKYLPDADGSVWNRLWPLVIEHGFARVAECDGKIIGYSAGEKLLRGAMAWHQIVDKNYRNRGIGTQLMDALEDAFRDAGIPYYIGYARPNMVEYHKKRGADIGEQYVEILKKL